MKKKYIIIVIIIVIIAITIVSIFQVNEYNQNQNVNSLSSLETDNDDNDSVIENVFKVIGTSFLLLLFSGVDYMVCCFIILSIIESERRGLNSIELVIAGICPAGIFMTTLGELYDVPKLKFGFIISIIVTVVCFITYCIIADIYNKKNKKLKK